MSTLVYIRSGPRVWILQGQGHGHIRISVRGRSGLDFLVFSRTPSTPTGVAAGGGAPVARFAFVGRHFAGLGMINVGLFDARCHNRDFYLGLHLWALVRGDSVVAGEFEWRANAESVAIVAVCV